MTNVKPQHPNARLTPRHRLNMVTAVIDDGWSIEQTADRFHSPKSAIACSCKNSMDASSCSAATVLTTDPSQE